MPRPRVPFHTLSLCCLLLAGCSGPRPRDAGDNARRGGTFKLILQGLPETLDPPRIGYLPDWMVASFIYEGLVGYGDNATELRPLLAESWVTSEGGRNWVFQLRDEVYFHADPSFPAGRGRKVTASDVRYTFERIAQKATACESWYLLSGKIEGIDDFREGRAAAIRGIRVLDDRHVEFRLTKPYATFLKVLASPTAYIVPREAVEFYGPSFGSLPVGTGPFRLVRWKPAEQLLFVRSDRYWRTDGRGTRLPYLDGIDIRVRAGASESVVLAEFLKGETHLFSAQEKLYDTLKKDVLNAQKCRVAGIVPTAALRFLGFSLDTPSPFARHAELRRAMAMSLDRGDLVRRAPEVNIILANSLAPPMFMERRFPWYPYDLAAASTIFARHRQELEQSPPVLASNFQSGEPALLQAALAKAGVRSAVRITPANYYPYIVRERPTLFRVSFTPSFFDPEDYYCLFYSKSSKEVNLTGYRNPEYDQMLEAAMVEQDAARRTRLFQSLEEILQRDVPAIYLTHGTPTYVVAALNVEGLTLRFLFTDLSAAWLSKTDAARTQPQK